MTLHGTRVLLVEDDEDARELLGLSLTHRGAEVRQSASGEDACAVAGSWTPDVVLMDLSLPGMDGLAAFERIRTQDDCHRCVGIALSGHGREADRARSMAAGFAKHLVKPAAIGDIISAIKVSITPVTDTPSDVRSILRQLNLASSCQFTSILRFNDEGRLVSVWTHDRTIPDMDSFPVDLPIEASYCVLVRDGGTTVVVADARSDVRVAHHPKRTELAAYLGVPIVCSDGSLFGTLCSYDVDPRVFTDEARAAHESAARALARVLDELPS